jgi:hypothetical protein
LSKVDKTITNAYYVIDIDRKSQRPVSVQFVVMTGEKGGTEAKGKKITGGRHVVFMFEYKLGDYDQLKAPTLPPEAAKLLARQ